MTGGRARFRCSDPMAGDFEFPDVEAVLDALEAALVSPDTPMLDTVRQSWQPVAAHPEVRAAWAGRIRFRPPDGTALVLPELPAPAAIGVGTETETRLRQEAYARIRRPVPDPPDADSPPAGHSRAVLVALAGLVLLVLIGWGAVALAGGLTLLAARAAGFGR
jgi:hypothetical protein